MKIQAYLTAAAVNLKRLAAAVAALLLMLLPIHRQFSTVHGRLIGSAFATAPVVCLTLAKWETVSGRFGGYLTSILTKAAREFPR